MKDHSIVSKAFSKSKNKSNPGILFCIANDAIDKANTFFNKSTFIKPATLSIASFDGLRFFKKCLTSG